MNIKKTQEFLKNQFDVGKYFKLHEEEKRYRLEHSYRVANIGKEIALKEGFNVEATVIGCLLHDVSYGRGFDQKEDWLNHGRTSASIARPFLEGLNLDREVIEEICYGIAIHVDDMADIEGNRTPLAVTIGEADNIDRFGAYRIFENLKFVEFDKMTLLEKQEKVHSILEKLHRYKQEPLTTKTATQLWISKLDFQIEFYKRLQEQLEYSCEIS